MAHFLRDIMKKDTLTVAGIHSGQATDGVDAAIVTLNATGDGMVIADVPAHAVFPYPETIRERLVRLADTSKGALPELAHLNVRLGRDYANAVKSVLSDAGLGADALDLCGMTGHVIVRSSADDKAFFNLTGGHASLLRIADPAIVTDALAKPVVSGFEESDIASGGMGGPILALADKTMFERARENVVAVNVGGVTSVTCLPADPAEPIIAYDACAGTVFLDMLYRKTTLDETVYDHDGELTLSGDANWRMLNYLRRDSYLDASPPKTTDRHRFVLDYIDDYWTEGIGLGVRPRDMLTTAARFIVSAVFDSVKRFVVPVIGEIDRVVVSGGGALNRYLMKKMRDEFAGVSVSTSDEFGIPVTARSAVGAAILAVRTLHGLPGNLPAMTAARHETVLGRISVPPSGAHGESAVLPHQVVSKAESAAAPVSKKKSSLPDEKPKPEPAAPADSNSTPPAQADAAPKSSRRKTSTGQEGVFDPWADA